jgi:hypothetical protein
VKTNKAIEWLRSFLLDGARLQEEIVEAGDAAGFNEKMLRRAKGELKVESRREASEAGHGKWSWRLPETP